MWWTNVCLRGRPTYTSPTVSLIKLKPMGRPLETIWPTFHLIIRTDQMCIKCLPVLCQSAITQPFGLNKCMTCMLSIEYMQNACIGHLCDPRPLSHVGPVGDALLCSPILSYGLDLLIASIISDQVIQTISQRSANICLCAFRPNVS